MKHYLKTFSVGSVLLALVLFQSTTPEIQAQSIYKINADKGGGGSTPAPTSEESGNGLMIVAGIVIAGAIVYGLYQKFNSDTEDSTATSENSLNRMLQYERNTFVKKVESAKEKLPVDLFFAVKNQSAAIPGRTYSVGLSFKF